MMSGKRRQRSPTFQKKRFTRWWQLSATAKKEILGKFEGGLSKARQMQAWVCVKKEVMETSKIDRSIDELKKKWSDLKIDAKKKVRNYELEKKKTGGGDAPIRPDEILFIVVETIGQESVDGISGGVDSSALTETSDAQRQSPLTEDSPVSPCSKRRRLRDTQRAAGKWAKRYD